MRIGIDGRELLARPTGVGRYLRELLAEWCRSATHHQFLVYVPDSPNSVQELSGACASFQVRRIGSGSGTRWEQLTLGPAVNDDVPDVLFAPAYTAPLLCRVPVVLTIHDISFVARPEWFRWREGIRRRWLTNWSARRAARIVTDSFFSKREIVERLHLPDGRISVIPIGVRPPVAPSFPEGYGRHEAWGTREPLVLFVGSILNRRRVPDLIAAFARVAKTRPDARLAVVGDNRTFPPQDLAAEARSAGVVDRVSLRSYVTDQELAELYHRASVFVFLSEYEGFGLPPLEALAAGVPVIVLDTPVAREVCRDAAVYVKRGDIEGTAAAILALLTDNTARDAALSHASAVLERYSWERAATATLSLLEDAATRHR